MEEKSKTEEEYETPKMVKYADDKCYAISFDKEKASCIICWLKGSCEANYKSQIKKKMMAKKKKPAPREKPYKKTDKYREW